MTQHLDLDALQAAAEAAGTEHAWHWHADPIKGDPLGRSRYEVTTLGRTITRTYYNDPTALHEAAFIAAFNPQTCRALIDRLRKAEAASDGWKLIHVQSFLSILDRSDWRTAKNRAELRAMIAAPDSTPTDSAENTKGGAA